MPEIIQEGTRLDSVLLSPDEAKFIALVSSGNSLMDAYAEVYPSAAGTKWLGQYASRLARSPRVKEQIELLQQAIKAHFTVLALRAADRVEELAENAKTERVKLDANLEILRQGGIIPPQRTESIHIGIFGNASAQDLRALIKNKIEMKEEEK